MKRTVMHARMNHKIFIWLLVSILIIGVLFYVNGSFPLTAFVDTGVNGEHTQRTIDSEDTKKTVDNTKTTVDNKNTKKTVDNSKTTVDNSKSTVDNTKTAVDSENTKTTVATQLFPSKLIQDKVDRLLNLHVNNTFNNKKEECLNPVVPSIVHWTWLYKDPGYTMKFSQCISALSVIRYLQPERIMMWLKHTPKGTYWHYFIRELNKTKTRLDIKNMEIPRSVFGIGINVPEHASDVARLDKLIIYGGIYLDLDVVVLKSFAPLMCYDVVLGEEKADKLCNGIIIAKPNATFLNIWRETYRTFRDGVWDEHNVRMPMVMAHLYPHLLHIEKDSMNKPNYKPAGLSKIYKLGAYYDWKTKNFALHTWYRFYMYQHSPEDIKGLNSTLGQMFRYVYYGSPDLLPTDTDYDKLKLPLQSSPEVKL